MFFKKIKIMLFVFLFSISLAGCNFDSQQSNSSTTKKTSTREKEAQYTNGTHTNIIKSYDNLNLEQTKGNIKVTIPSIKEVKTVLSDKDYNILKETSPNLVENGKSLNAIIVFLKIQNLSNKKIEAYPDQSILVVNGVQINDDMILKDESIPAGDILGNAKKEGAIPFIVEKIEDLNSVKFSFDTYINPNAEDVENIEFEFDINLNNK